MGFMQPPKGQQPWVPTSRICCQPPLQRWQAGCSRPTWPHCKDEGQCSSLLLPALYSTLAYLDARTPLVRQIVHHVPQIGVQLCTTTGEHPTAAGGLSGTNTGGHPLGPFASRVVSKPSSSTSNLLLRYSTLQLLHAGRIR